ncbi:MAG: glycosyltransferase family 4 protein [Prevotellaceae bacterium]|nr:glycosyltransferase family 4 protein [Prevotellaceae bacterium]
MRVLQITSNYPTKTNPIFGIFMKEQIQSLEQYEVENTIFFSNGSETKYGALVHFCSVFKLQWHLLWNKYDLIHCHSNISGLIVMLSGAWLFKKCILSFQNDPEKEHDAKVFRKLYPLFKKVIVKKPTKYLEWKNVIYLPNGCNTDFFKPMERAKCKKEIGLKEEVDYLLFVDSNTSKRRTQKRKDRFDETLQILRAKYGHNIEELVMVGVKRDLVPIWMNACSLHLMTSDLEGSPNSIKECLMCNVPIVSTDVGNVREMVEDISGAYISDTFSAEELAECAHKVLISKSEFRGREILMSKGYGINAVGQKLYNIYKEVISIKKKKK